MTHKGFSRRQCGLLDENEFGGIGDAVAALSTAVNRRGHQVKVVIPRYRGVECGPEVDSFPVHLGFASETVRIARCHWPGDAAGRPELLAVDCPSLFDRPGVYGNADGTGYGDNAKRFSLLNIIGFAVLVFTLFGVQVLFVSGAHSLL